MADSATTHHGFILPEINFSKNTWGTKLNNNWSALDAILHPSTGLFLGRSGGSMSGPIVLSGNPVDANHATSKSYVDGLADLRYSKTESDARYLQLSGGAVSGALSLNFSPSLDAHAVNKLYVDQQILTRLTQAAADARYLKLSGGVMSGALSLSGDPTSSAHAVNKSYFDTALAARLTQAAADARYLQLSGGTLSGSLSLSGDPVLQQHAANKAYVDSQIATRITQASADSRYAIKSAQNVFSSSQIINGVLVVKPLVDTSLALFDFKDSLDRYLMRLYSSIDNSLVVLRSYATPGGVSKDFSFNGETGRFTASSFFGDGGSITGLNASALALGTVPDARIPNTVARTSTTITGGNGLQNSGNLGQDNITISLGTPGTITTSSTNSVSQTSHTHALPASVVGGLLGSLQAGAIGSTALMEKITAGAVGPGGVVEGSALRYSSTQGLTSSIIPAGIWVCCGYADGDQATHDTTDFRRVE